MEKYVSLFNISNKRRKYNGKIRVKIEDSFKDNYLKPALDNGLIKMTLPDKSTSKNQMYYKN